MVWSMAKNSAFDGEKQNEKRQRSFLCEIAQITLKPQACGCKYDTKYLYRKTGEINFFFFFLQKNLEHL